MYVKYGYNFFLQYDYTGRQKFQKIDDSVQQHLFSQKKSQYKIKIYDLKKKKKYQGGIANKTICRTAVLGKIKGGWGGEQGVM